MRWFNLYLCRSRSSKVVKNLEDDILDGVNFSLLIHQLIPSQYNVDSLLSSKPIRRAEAMLSALCRHLGSSSAFSSFKAEELVSGSERLSLLFLAQLFSAFPTCTPADDLQLIESLLDQSNAGGFAAEKAALRLWVRSFGLVFATEEAFDAELGSGSLVVFLLSRVMPESVSWSKVKRHPQNRFQLVENWNYIVSVFKQIGANSSDMRVPDLVDGKWPALKFLLTDLQDFDMGYNMLRSVVERDLITWANRSVSSFSGASGLLEIFGGGASSISSFRDPSIRSSKFLFELLQSLDVGCLDMSKITPGITPEEQLQNAKEVAIAVWRLGVPSFLLPTDITDLKSKRLLVFFHTLRSHFLSFESD
eukprot:GILI01001525.1.p1 GENE.GILI01001525.1~~GILI01001525.1.p1  ORF type:complete len:363 (+),score=110.46 GILI01001525.1:472-1560(+)